MSKQELLDILKLLSAVESAMLMSKASMPDHLYDQLANTMAVLEREILR